MLLFLSTLEPSCPYSLFFFYPFPGRMLSVYAVISSTVVVPWTSLVRPRES